MKLRLALALIALSLFGCATPQPGLVASSSYTNPVLDADFPDPTVIRAGDGFYYAYATQSSRRGHMVNIQVARSGDLVHWQELGDALPAKPDWAARTQDFWAPHVVRNGATYLMYYSAKPDAALTDDKQGLCLAVAQAAVPQGPFTDMGRPLKCGESFVNIDPMVIDAPQAGGKLIYWGSGFKPIHVQALDRSGKAFAPGSTPRALVYPNPVKDQFPVLIEGAWVHRRGGYYYLFYSGDNCCGAKANYAVMVARSRSALGPFQTLESARGVRHSIILEKRGKWIAPGHNSIVTDAAGQDWIVYHAVDVARPRAAASDDTNTRRVMLIDRIVWRDGWPVIDGPSERPQPAPRTR